MEVWKVIKYHSDYAVSSLGRVKRLARCIIVWNNYQNCERRYPEKIMKLCDDKDGYKLVTICKKTYKVHRLVAEVFIDNVNNYEHVNHLDGVKTNNIVSNLEWVNHQDNITHKVTKLHKHLRGACWHKKIKKWYSKIDFKGKRIHIGYFNTKEEALEAYNKKFKELYNQEAW